MGDRIARLFLLALLPVVSVSDAEGWLLDEKDPVLKEIISEVVFYAGFDDESPDADMSLGDNKAAVNGKPIYEAGVSGKAFRNADFRYPIEKNLQIDKPGSLSFWIAPYQWVRGNDEPLQPFFLTDYKGDGFLGLERQGQIIKDGKLARQGGLLMWFHYFKDIPSLSSACPCDWKDGEWHFIVITWRGPKWELFVDAKSQFVVPLPRALKQEEMPNRFVIESSSSLIDEFTIYRRPLSEAEIKRIYEVGTKKP